jgi:hypothetical protein
VPKSKLTACFDAQVVQVDIPQRCHSLGKYPGKVHAFEAKIEDFFGRTAGDKRGEFQDGHGDAFHCSMDEKRNERRKLTASPITIDIF